MNLFQENLFPVSLGYFSNSDLDLFKIAIEIYADPSLSIVENTYDSDRFMLLRDYNLIVGGKDLKDFWELVSILRVTFHSINN